MRQNWWTDALLGIGAVLAVLSSHYFLVYPVSGYQERQNPDDNKVLIFSRTAWDMLHTWSGVGLSIGAILQVVLHWKWITNITRKVFGPRRVKSNTGQAVLEPVE